MRTVITYGTFDLFHVGHVRLLERARKYGDRLVVGVSTDEFNLSKGKRSIFSYSERAEIIRSLKVVDEVFPEKNWSQKKEDINRYNAGVLVMGGDWEGKFDDLKSVVNVVYFPRTPDISTTSLKSMISEFSSEKLDVLREAADLISSVVRGLK